MFWRLRVKLAIKKDMRQNKKDSRNIKTTMVVDDKFHKVIYFSKSCDNVKMPTKTVRLL